MLDNSNYTPLKVSDEDPKGRNDLNATELTTSFKNSFNGQTEQRRSYPIKRSQLLKFLVIVLCCGVIPSFGASYLNQCA